MRVVIALALTATWVMSSLPIAAWAQGCPPGSVWVCRQEGPQGGKRGSCACQGRTGFDFQRGGGKAEIHKKNVPTVRPSRTPGPND
jgi:hypothetical protein